MSEGNGYATRDSFMAAAGALRTAEAALPNGQKLKLESIRGSEAVKRLDVWLIAKIREVGEERYSEYRSARAVQLLARNPDGSEMFSDDDLEWLVNECQCGFFETAAVAALELIEGATPKQVKEAAKNSEASPN